MMRVNILFLFLLIMFNSFGQSQTGFFNKADLFFRMYTKDGRVNYEALRENSAPLDELVDYIATETIDKRTEKAYLINTYNILVIDKLVHYQKQVDSPMKISGFFESSDLMVEGMKVSLNQIENEMIRPVYNDPRIHFVLVCGGLGCPPIANFAYRPEKLDLQLEHQTKTALNNADFVYTQPDKKTIYLSQIFEWYQQDFGGSSKETINYINTYRDSRFDPTYKVKYYPYDWNINSAEFEIIRVELEGQPETPRKDSVFLAEDVVPVPEEKDQESISIDPNTIISSTNRPIPEGLIDELPTNLQTFTAGSLLRHRQYDFTLFNTLYTENKNNWEGNNFTGYRATFVTHLAQITYGITKSRRINVGLDINFRYSGRSIDASYSGISEAFTFKNDYNSRVGITALGARVKVQPFKNVSNFSIQSTLSVPTIRHPEGFNDPNFETNENDLYWADWDRITWWNQFFLDKTFGKFQLFTEIDLLFRFRRYDSQIGMLDLPANIFLSYFPTNKITFYGMTQHVARFTNNINGHDLIVTDWVIPMNYTASGIGFKYQFLPNLNLELLYTNFWRGKNSGLGETFNVGIKFLTR